MLLDYEIIVSFSTSDNTPGISGKCWVLQFRQYLKLTLAQITGQEPKIIFHSEADVFDKSHYHHNSYVIMVISPAYLKSGLCHRELKEYSALGMDPAGVSGRIFKVVKSPVEDSMLPESIKYLNLHSFYQDKYFKFHSQQDEWHADLYLKLLDLAYDIQKRVQKKRSNIFGLQGHSINPVKKVYLALTAHDLQPHRDIIQRELARQDIEVHPRLLLLDDLTDIEQKIRKEMETCELSIHLIGEDYGDILKGAEKSLVEIQNNVALEISSDPFRSKLQGSKTFSRFVWISPDLKKINEKQKIFIENIKRDTKALKEDEILQVPFDELKEIIQNKIILNCDLPEKFFAKDPYKAKGKGSIYLIHEKADQQISEKIASYLEMEGYEVIFPDLDGDQLSIRKKHQEYLRICDASLIICGEVNIEWINIKLQDLIKAPGFGRVKPFKAKALFVKNKKYLQIHQELMNLEGSIILESSENLIPDNFFLFLNKITA